MANEKKQKTIPMVIGDRTVEAILNEDGSIVMPQEIQEMLAIGAKVMAKATSPSEESQTKEPKVEKEEKTVRVGSSTPSDSFKGLPMRDLIGAPLFAAAEAQQKLASVAWEFYQKIAYEETTSADTDTNKEDENNKPEDNALRDGPTTTPTTDKTTRNLKFDLERPVIEDGVATTQKIQVQAPFIGLVPIPSLLIDRVDVDFQMEVTDTNVTKEDSSKEASTDLSSKWFGVKANISGKVSSSRENTRTTDQTAKYQVHVTASQQQPTEGLSKLMDVMASCIEPIVTDKA